MKRIPLTRGYETVVDDQDFDFLNQWKWFVLTPTPKKRYAARCGYDKGKRSCIYMHRVLTNAPADKEVDHRDGDGLNNRRYNFRVCLKHRNLQNRGPQSNNTCGYKGVAKAWPGKWVAQIQHQGKRLRLGYFTTPEAAAHAYDEKARILHGEFAYLNFPSDKVVGNIST